MRISKRDRRTYKRLSVRLHGTAYYNNNSVEIRVDNISEEDIGFYFEIPKVDGDMDFEVGDFLTIQFIDEYMYGHEEYVSIETVVGKVVQIRGPIDDEIYVGCSVRADFCDSAQEYREYYDYVSHRKSASFIKMVQGIRFNNGV